MLAVLLKGITFKHHDNFFCLNCLHSFETENKRGSQKKYAKIENKSFCNVVVPSKVLQERVA